MPTNDCLYKACDFFYIRIPTRPINRLYNLEMDEIYNIFQTDNLFREGVLIANNSLFNIVDKAESKNYNNGISLLNYYRRMTSRSTPFGCFAASGVGSFSDYTSYNSDYSIKKKYSASSDWLHLLIQKYEKNFFILSKLSLMRNPNVIYRGNRIYLIHNDADENYPPKSSVSIAKSYPIMRAFEITSNIVSGQFLFETLRKEYQEVDEQQIKNMIINLTYNGFLISEFKKPNLSLQYVLSVLSIDKSLFEYKELNEVCLLLDDVNKHQLITGNNYNKLVKAMRGIVESEHYIQVNTVLKDINISISKSIAEEIAMVWSWLWTHYRSLIKKEDMFLYSKFIDRFGENVRVPFLLVYDVFGELNFDTYSETDDHFYSLILDEIIKCSVNKLDNINLEHILKEKIEDSEEECSPPDTEIYGRIMYNQNDDDFIFILNNHIQSDSIGRSIGRFLEYLPDKKVLKSLNKLYNETFPQQVDMLFEPNKKRWKDVLNTSDILENKLVINQFSEGLDLYDIQVIATNRKFLFWSKTLNKRIEFVKIDMLNRIFYPKALRFLVMLQAFNRSIRNGLLFRKFYKLSYCPRIQYKRVIFKPASWCFKNQGNRYNEYMFFLKEFEGFILQYNVPVNVYFVLNDRKILVNLKSSNDIKYLYKNLKNEGSICLEEFIQIDNYSLIKNGDDNYVSEVVIPLIGSRQTKKNVFSFYNNHSYIFTDEFIYFKLYLNMINMNSVLDLWNKEILKSNNKIESFFIRYIDNEGPHLRIRIKAPSDILISLIPCITGFYKVLLDKNLVHNMKYEVYYPEIERYGGIKYFDKVVDYFCLESNFIFDVIGLPEEFVKKHAEMIMAYNFLTIVKKILPYDVLFTLWDIENIKNKNLFEYNKNKKLFYEYFNNTTDNTILYIRGLIQEKEEKSRLYCISEIEDNEKVFMILLNILHMSCNRMSILDKNLENKTKEIIRCYLRDLRHWKDLVW